MRLRYLFLSLGILSLTGCSGTFFKPYQQTAIRAPSSRENAKRRHHNLTPVGRYSSISNVATRAQQNPLLAIAQFKFSARVKTVGQALLQVLQDTGYSLVPEKQLPRSVRKVLAKPLPVTQRELGPISMKDALSTLMDSQVFRLMVDPVNRRVTFRLKHRFSHIRGHRYGR